MKLDEMTDENERLMKEVTRLTTENLQLTKDGKELVNRVNILEREKDALKAEIERLKNGTVEK